MNTPHYLTLAVNDGETSLDWTHPADCPDGDTCEFARRTRRMGSHDLWDLVEGREPGRYLLARFGFQSLILVDEHGNQLPDVNEAPKLPSALDQQREVRRLDLLEASLIDYINGDAPPMVGHILTGLMALASAKAEEEFPST